MQQIHYLPQLVRSGLWCGLTCYLTYMPQLARSCLCSLHHVLQVCRRSEVSTWLSKLVSALACWL